jgi:hypothetical protein
MKRAFAISLPLVTAVAASLGLSACERKDEWEAQGPSRVCTDADGRRIMDAECQRGGAAHWYFYGGGLPVAAFGQRVYGGSYVAERGVRYGSPARVSRGGFGGFGRGFRGGE